MGEALIIRSPASIRGRRLVVEVSLVLKILMIRWNTDLGSRGRQAIPATMQTGSSLRFQKKRNTTAATTRPIQLARP